MRRARERGVPPAVHSAKLSELNEPRKIALFGRATASKFGHRLSPMEPNVKPEFPFVAAIRQRQLAGATRIVHVSLGQVRGSVGRLKQCVRIVSVLRRACNAE